MQHFLHAAIHPSYRDRLALKYATSHRQQLALAIPETK
ncbi:septation protein IspZ, partial [Acinetobacter baumannii]|nr:septation protein IspZ [Acinetobacter baumannii]